MNRWSKYGGIMPETINISKVIWNPNHFINATGSIVSNTDFHYTNNIFLSKGRYKIAVYTNTNFNTAHGIRIHRYNGNTWIEQILYYSISNLTTSELLSFELNIPEDSEIKVSIYKTMNILEIEKL